MWKNSKSMLCYRHYDGHQVVNLSAKMISWHLHIWTAVFIWSSAAQTTKNVSRDRIPKLLHVGKALCLEWWMWLAMILRASLKNPPIMHDNVFFDPTLCPSVPQVHQGSLASKLQKMHLAHSGCSWQGALDCDVAGFMKIVSSCAFRAATSPLRTCWGKEKNKHCSEEKWHWRLLTDVMDTLNKHHTSLITCWIKHHLV